MIGCCRWARCGTAALIGVLLLPAVPARAADGPATRTDLDFVRRVHLTATGVGTASALARGMSANVAVKGLARQVTTQCEQLDGLSQDVAATLAVPLDGPLADDQQSALTALQRSGGEAFDTGYVDYLWQANSELLPIAATVKGTTRNQVVRRLAERAEAVTAAQLPMLQDSGLLKMAVLPAAVAPSAAGRLFGGVPMDQELMAQTRSGAGYLAPPVWIRLAVLLAATGAAGFLSWHLLVRSRAGRVRARRLPVRRRRPQRPVMPEAGRASGPRHRRSAVLEAGRVGRRRREVAGARRS